METGKGNWKRRLKAEIVISDFLAADLQWLSLLHIPEHSPSPVFKLYCVLCFIVLCPLIEWRHVHKCDKNKLSVYRCSHNAVRATLYIHNYGMLTFTPIYYTDMQTNHFV